MATHKEEKYLKKSSTTAFYLPQFPLWKNYEKSFCHGFPRWVETDLKTTSKSTQEFQWSYNNLLFFLQISRTIQYTSTKTFRILCNVNNIISLFFFLVFMYILKDLVFIKIQSMKQNLTQKKLSLPFCEQNVVISLYQRKEFQKKYGLFSIFLPLQDSTAWESIVDKFVTKAQNLGKIARCIFLWPKDLIETHYFLPLKAFFCLVYTNNTSSILVKHIFSQSYHSISTHPN